MPIPKNDWYSIQSGDTLSKIAKEAGIADWKTIYNDPQNADFRKQRPDPDRTAFGNHAFCGISVSTTDNVIDGCAGPHIGNESRKKYLDNSIDRTMGGDGHITDIVIYKEVNTVE